MIYYGSNSAGGSKNFLKKCKKGIDKRIEVRYNRRVARARLAVSEACGDRIGL